MVTSNLYHELCNNPKYGLTEAVTLGDSVYTRPSTVGFDYCYVPWSRNEMSKLIRVDMPHLSRKDVERDINERVSRLQEHPLSTADNPNLHDDYHEHAYFADAWWSWRDGVFFCPLENRVRDIMPIESLDLLAVEIEYSQINALSIVKSWFPNDDDAASIETLYQFLAYCIMEHRDFEKMLVFYGKQGVGKSACLNMVQCFLRHSNVLETAFTNLDEKRFQVAEFVGKRLVYDPDVMDQKGYLSATILKKLVSSDTVSIERKNVQQQDTPNLSAKFIACSNYFMRFRDPEPMLKRIIPISFSNTFRGGPDDVRNSELSKTFKSKPFRLSLAKAVLKHGSSLIINGGFTLSQSSEELNQYWVASADPLGYFIRSQAYVGGPTPAQAVREDFVKFCSTMNIPYHKGLFTLTEVNAKCQKAFNSHSSFIIKSGNNKKILISIRV